MLDDIHTHTSNIYPYTYIKCLHTGLSVEALGGDGVDLVDKDDGGGIFAGQPEHVADHAGALIGWLVGWLVNAGALILAEGFSV